MPKFLTLRREGEFKVKTAGDNHCGLDKEQKIKYAVQVHCKASSIDDRGFLFEQRLIDQFFQEHYTDSEVFESCEILSMDCTSAIKELILDENPNLKLLSIEVQLSAKPYQASMTHTWISKKT